MKDALLDAGVAQWSALGGAVILLVGGFIFTAMGGGPESTPFLIGALALVMIGNVAKCQVCLVQQLNAAKADAEPEQAESPT